jgi:hypothetical protein
VEVGSILPHQKEPSMSDLMYGRIPSVGEEVRVYRNLHRAMWSVQARVAGKGWRVVFHAATVLLDGAVFEVNETGRQKVLRERKKNVHAFVRGRLVQFAGPGAMGDGRRTDAYIRPVTYNPFKAPTFVEASTFPPVPVTEAYSAWLTDDRTSRVWVAWKPGTLLP